MTHPLRAFRLSRELTLAELSMQVGVGKSALSKIETGRSTPSVDLIKRLVAASEGQLRPQDFFVPPEAAQQAA